jgi:hypothetical protein
MRDQKQLGLDELMIVNPCSSGAEVMFLGADGTLYQVQGQRFLGEDGSLYQVQGFDTDLGQYFLGADGVLYEVVR